eukprot:CAMPEP_0196761934 /NCGR_PEP_ID=MMETSP1095-20130614/1249_1 /TAXON_ID=96789 ORGANISM="Chromulina nebulosa, Strain UTEXLB2642" /NCGR_SAMPLE_ID=MMETSP1095 /ASSEMBLY_ACC=CAM_ASM_000446 /LENGTH=231 /DNA_ID=CAMNT_0042112049 /DNA_START=270 /DNA_END=968 /DNA_ORIENTATION=+
MSDSSNPPDDLEAAIASLSWASDRLNIPELLEVKNQLTKKFGKKYMDKISNLQFEKVNERLLKKLSIDAPSASLVMNYLVEIAKEFNIDWSPSDVGLPDNGLAFQSPIGFSIPMAPGTQLSNVYQRASNHFDDSIPSNQDPGSNNISNNANKTGNAEIIPNDFIPPTAPQIIPIVDAVYLPPPAPVNQSNHVIDLPSPPNNQLDNGNSNNNNNDDGSLDALQARLNALRDL